MSKRIILIAIILILAGAAWYYNHEKNRVISSHDFLIDDTSTVDKIILEKDNQIVKLEKVEGDWIVNDTFQVNKALVKRFLRVFSNLNLIAPISNNSGDSIIESLKKNGTKISIFSDNNIQKTYFLGDLNDVKSGNYLSANDKVGILNASGLVNDLKDIVSVNKLFWRNRRVFNKSLSQIIRITHKSVRNKEKSYTIFVKNDELSLFNYSNEKIENIDKVAVSRYLSYFQNIGFKQIENSLTTTQKDSIIKLNLAHTIILEDNSNVLYELNLYLKPTKDSDKGISQEFDLNHIYGIINKEKNILIFEYYIIDPILKELNYFLTK
ncbi:MAG: hypothetical protein ABFS35_16745 [Bacteroidota bacterium]